MIRPEPGHSPGLTTWILAHEDGLYGKTVAKLRITPDRPGGSAQLGVHPGRDWFTVLSGIARLELGERTILVHPGEVAEFSTMTPHAIGAHEGPVEILSILNHDGGRAHLHAADHAAD
ncbi:cupin domain-containing protein [Arthrobacter sp. ERGS1:01]|uniref:cupin domain-containing protein n=1 Tax=Arthrobacter sp. ERGS1:01 TaxID=1704044 RepID=UPI000A83D8AA